MGDRNVVQSTATLACVGRRQAYFKDEFLTALEILNRGDLRPEQMRGSWAGAFGPTQFMPTAFKRYAVDGDGDGRRDVVDNAADLIASTANNLKKDGWQTGRSWGYEVVLPEGFNFMLADKAKAMTIAQWQSQGMKRADGKPFPDATEKAYLLAPAGTQGPGFLMLQNFRVIMKYNPAEAYALAIGHFADRLRGGPPFVQPWPRQERVLSRAERLELQQLLAQRGFYRGTPDGQFGGQTREALRSFQASIGAPADGFASSDVLERLRGQSPWFDAFSSRERSPLRSKRTLAESNPENHDSAEALTVRPEPRFMGKSARLRPDSATIFDTSRSIATEPDAKAKVLLARVHRHRPAGRAGGCDRASGRDRRPGVGAVLQFRRLRGPPQRQRRSVAAAGLAAISFSRSSSRPRNRRRARISPARPGLPSATRWRNVTCWCWATPWPTGSAMASKTPMPSSPTWA